LRCCERKLGDTASLFTVRSIRTHPWSDLRTITCEQTILKIRICHGHLRSSKLLCKFRETWPIKVERRAICGAGSPLRSFFSTTEYLCRQSNPWIRILSLTTSKSHNDTSDLQSAHPLDHHPTQHSPYQSFDLLSYSKDSAVHRGMSQKDRTKS